MHAPPAQHTDAVSQKSPDNWEGQHINNKRKMPWRHKLRRTQEGTYVELGALAFISHQRQWRMAAAHIAPCLFYSRSFRRIKTAFFIWFPQSRWFGRISTWCPGVTEDVIPRHSVFCELVSRNEQIRRWDRGGRWGEAECVCGYVRQELRWCSALLAKQTADFLMSPINKVDRAIYETHFFARLWKNIHISTFVRLCFCAEAEMIVC